VCIFRIPLFGMHNIPLLYAYLRGAEPQLGEKVEGRVLLDADALAQALVQPLAGDHVEDIIAAAPRRRPLALLDELAGLADLAREVVGHLLRRGDQVRAAVVEHVADRAAVALDLVGQLGLALERKELREREDQAGKQVRPG